MEEAAESIHGEKEFEKRKSISREESMTIRNDLNGAGLNVTRLLIKPKVFMVFYFHVFRITKNHNKPKPF